MKSNWKTILLGAISFIVLFVSTSVSIKKCTNSKDDITLVGDTISSEGKVMEFEYQHHKFINIVKINSDDKNESFVVHDPNCRCMTKKLNNITTVITNTDNHNTNKSDSISKANFRVIISKLNSLHNDNVLLMKEIKTLRTEVAMLKRVKTNPVYKPVRKVIHKKRR